MSVKKEAIYQIVSILKQIYNTYRPIKWNVNT